MAKVRDVMTKTEDIPKVTTRTTVLEATKVMNDNGSSAVAVLGQGDKVVGMFGERTLATEFVGLDKKPDEVQVGTIMHAIYRIGPEADTKEAARKIIEYGATRLGVFDGDRFLGWVTLTDLSRHFSRENLVDRLRTHDVPEAVEVRCPNCNKAFMEKVTDGQGKILRWQCPNCGYAL